MADNQQYQDMGSNKARVMLSLGALFSIIIIVFLFLLFGNLKTGTPVPVEKIVPQSVTTNYNTTNNYYSGRKNNYSDSRRNNTGGNYSKKIAEDTETGNSYLKQIAENTARINEKIDNLRADVNNLRTEVSGLRDDVKAGMANIRQDVNNGFTETHTDLIILNRTVKSLGDLGKHKKKLGEKKDSYWDIPDGAKQ